MHARTCILYFHNCKLWKVWKREDIVKECKRKSNLSSNENQQENNDRKSYFEESDTEGDEEFNQSLLEKENHFHSMTKETMRKEIETMTEKYY